MNVAFLVIFAALVLALGYFTYGRVVSRWLGVDENRPTPAHTMTDGVDYVPARAPVLLGHHFASIAGAGPIVGPVIAAAYGWLPAFLWIIIGVIFIGAMLDFSAVIASVRHQGRSIGQVIEHNIGRSGKKLFLTFSWFALVLVIAAFINVVAKTFADAPEVATASGLFILLAICFGTLVYRRGVPLSIATVIGIICIVISIWVGDQKWAQMDLTKDRVLDSAAAVLASGSATPGERGEAEERISRRAAELDIATTDARGKVLTAAEIIERGKVEIGKRRWCWPLIIYIFCASAAPVWLLLQPRDYLNSFLLYAVLIGAFVGVVLARPVLNFPAFVSFNVAKPGPGPLFPFLFVVVACGAISGFHTLVGSGTTAKQLANERDAKPVAYGGMLIEAMLAVLAIAAVAILTQQKYSQEIVEKGAIATFAHGIALFMEALRIDHESGFTFVSLAISAFALTSLDTGTRLGRFAFQEFFEAKSQEGKPFLSRNRYVATGVTVVVSAVLARQGIEKIWEIFGSANQLLAALALLTISVWLARKGHRNLFTLIPMVFMFVVTLCALGILVYRNVTATQPNYVLASVAGLLFVLAITLIIESAKVLIARRQGAEPEAGSPGKQP